MTELVEGGRREYGKREKPRVREGWGKAKVVKAGYLRQNRNE